MENPEVDVESGSLGAENIEIYTPQVLNDVKPKVGQEFESLDDVYNFYNEYAKIAGFSVRSWSQQKKDGAVIRKEYVCYKQGKSSLVADVGKKRRRGNTKEDCKAKIAVTKTKSGAFVVSVFIEGHTHSLSTPSRVHFLRSHRGFSTAQKCLTQQLAMVNIPQHQQFNLLGVQSGGIENIGFIQRDLYNQKRNKRNAVKGHDGDMFHEYLKLEQAKNPSFTFKIEADVEQRITHCFWTDATSRRAYKFFGDVVIFDTTYKTNRYGLIFAPLYGVNNHGQTVLFACAFLCDETAVTFGWLFDQFLKAMPSDAPKMIITDQDPAMTKAISLALPNTYHRYCSWHILTKFSERLDTIKYIEYYSEFSSCIWRCETKDEFDSKWTDLVERSGLHENKWLQSLYDIRSQWVPAYVNHIFSAGMSSSQRAESAHSFYKRYVSKENSLVDFMIQFGRGLMHQRHEELMAYNKDMIEKPKLKMPHNFLVHMADVYTLEIFFKFQDELWESLNYRFELLGDNDSCCIYKVERKILGKKMVEKYRVREICYKKDLDFVSCSCKMFESSGVICRHVLGYLNKMHDFDKLPNQYILKRWCKVGKLETVIDDGGMEIQDDKLYLMKRNELIQMSTVVVDKALRSKEAIKVYTDALDGALEEIKKLVDCGTSVAATRDKCTIYENKSLNLENNYKEPSQARAKGCGKRIKRGKEKALRKGKQNKGRRCNGCNKVGMSHDKRNCPMLNNGEKTSQTSSCDNEDETDTNSNSDDGSYSGSGDRALH